MKSYNFFIKTPLLLKRNKLKQEKATRSQNCNSNEAWLWPYPIGYSSHVTSTYIYLSCLIVWIISSWRLMKWRYCTRKHLLRWNEPLEYHPLKKLSKGWILLSLFSQNFRENLELLLVLNTWLLFMNIFIKETVNVI